MQIERDGPQMDWHLLVKGAGAPPGNLRIAEAAPSPPPDHFSLGFPRRDNIDQRERFLDYAEERGATSSTWPCATPTITAAMRLF
jgi:serine/threonine-protein kinase HipA